METENLNFERSGRWSVAQFESPGTPVVVQLQQRAPGEVNVYANVEGMRLVRVGHFFNAASSDVIFSVDVAEGLMVTVQSFGEVERAKIVK